MACQIFPTAERSTFPVNAVKGDLLVTEHQRMSSLRLRDQEEARVLKVAVADQVGGPFVPWVGLATFDRPPVVGSVRVCSEIAR